VKKSEVNENGELAPFSLHFDAFLRSREHFFDAPNVIRDADASRA
jgi:hypothetical protein